MDPQAGSVPKGAKNHRAFTRCCQVTALRAGVSLAFAVAVLSGLALRPATAMAGPCEPPSNEIVCENSKPGNPENEWDVNGEGDSSIQGFATDISVDRGETIQFKVNTNSTKYRLDIYRMGYYGGDGARKVATVAGTPHSQPACDEEASTGLIDCGNWAVSASWAVPSGAVSGIYFAHLVREDKSSEGSHIVFVVRDDASESEMLFQTSDATWEAYNEYGGNSFYTGDPGEDPGRAYKVSYNRPLTTRGSGAQDAPFNAEYPMVRWLERNGYDVSYFTGVDTDRRGGEILNHEVFLSVGHDEYWSGTQRANVEAAREAGVNLAFFSGNEVFWKTRWENSIDGSGADHRTLVCYKETHANEPLDPEDPSVWTGTWRDPRFSPPADGGRPENELTGTIFAVNVGTTAIEVPAKYASLRLWRNTDIAELKPGETATLGEDTLGYEWDEDAENGFRPAGLVPLSSTTDEVPQRLVDYGSTYSPGTATHHLTLYRAESGALVFGAGTVQWPWGLDDRHDRGEEPVDSRMQQATVNLFADMGVQPGTLQAGLVPATETADTTPPTTSITKPGGEIEVQSGQPYTIEGTAVDSEGEGQGGGVIGAVEVSVDSGETWHLAEGAEDWSYTWTPEELGPTTILARATDDSANLGASAEVNVEVTAQACPCSIWDESFEAPQDSDSSAIELGVKFRTEVTGYVSGIRFYKTSGNTGTHVGRLWTTSGEQLAQVTFTGESGSGWQQADFDTPVEIKANTTYVASYYAPFGHYASIEDYFALAGYDNPPLHALADGTDGANGIYAYGSSGGLFSNGGPNTFHSENYLVNVSFEKKLVPDTTPPTIGSRTPVDGATEVATDVSASASFDEAMDPATIDGSTAELRDSFGTLIPATVSYDAGQRKVTIDPDEALDYSTAYTATIEGGSEGVADVAGNRLAADSSWTFSTAPPPPAPPDEGPGGPILVIANSGNSFSRYYDEILRAEGLNEFTATDITNVTPSLLAEYDVAILGDGPLSVTQAQTLSNWVEAGGNLVAMRPDAKLAGLLGISSAGGTLGNAYLKVDTSTTPGAGIVGDTIQFHGTADRYTTAGAQTVATLYSDASTSTSNPAVTLREVGENGGHAAAFTYDLAKSVVYTRQGNPAWNEDERDGISPVRSDDLFYGAKEGDEQPDWVDSEKIQIPQADEQQRLLTNLVEQMNVDRKPLPRFWFLPDDHKAAVVMTGDDHANNGTTGRFEHFESLDSPGCVVAEWQCVRSTSYIYPNTPISDAKAAGFVANGFEVALHTTNGCRNWDNQEDLEGTYSDLLAEFAADFPSLPAPTTNRMHCIVWSDWASQPKVELKDGIRLDTTYYYWPAKWVQNRPGLFTGSGMPMRFADLDGSLIDVYQAATQMTDESEQTYPFNAEVLLDNALGSKGYYGTFVANMHTDKVESPEADAIVAAAQARGVPVISARQLLTWLDGRNQSSFGGIEWSGNHLSFTISPAAGADGLRAMVPVESAIGALDAIEREGTPVATTTRTIKGVEYAFFDATAGSYTASYIDEQLPEISNVQVQAENDGTATVTWDTSEPASSRVDYGTSSGSLPFSQSDPEPVTSHSVQISGLEPNATYYFRVTSADGEANSVTEPEPLLSPGAFSTPPAAPVLSATVPASPANQNSPKLVGSAAAGTTVAVHTGADCSGSPVATGTAAQLEAGIEVAVGDDSSTEFRATATGGGGTSACSSPLAYLEDSTAPLTQIESGPLAVANSDSASFSFSGEDPGGSGLAALECRIDSADPEAWSACTSPQAYTELSEGGHEFEVRAVDNAGNADASPAIFEWTVDTAPPALSIDSGPEGLTTDSTPTFAFSAEPGAATECSIDTGTPAFGPCSDAGSHTPEEFLADGSYTFRVRATDAASNQTVETRAFEVDATAPTTQIDLAPPALANSAKATFEFSGDDGGGSGSGVASFECKLDVGGFAACSSGIEYTGLAEGSHKFEVRAIDNAGNVNGTPASSEWTIDSLAPTTQITSQPPVFDNDASATFQFSGEDPGGSGVAFFQCRRDSAEPADWQPCVSPLKYTSLAQGLHKFEVRAVDNAGNADAGPAIYEWTIDTKAPETQIDLGPPALAASAAASFEFGGEDPEGSGVASFQCRRDSADPEAWSACTSPQSYSELSDGPHKFEVRAVDQAGNVDASPAAYEWSIDTTPPALSIDSGPEGLTTNPTPTFGFAYSPAPGDTLECSIDSGEAAYRSCSGANSDTPSEPLANGEYTFRVRATDEAGNEALASRDFATDATVPDTQITLEPPALVASAEASFEFGGEDPEGSGVASFQCRRDSEDPEAWNACTSPLSYSGLAEGSHKFEVRAIDNAGNVNGSPASSEWSVDTVAPQTQIDVKPASLADSDEPSFEFSGSDPAGSGVGSFQCRRDSTEASAWEACASPHAYTELAQGPHKFEVRAIDKAGNVDQTPAAYEWTVDSVAPQTQIDKAPPALSNSAKATFEFSGEDPGGSGVVSFQCRRDSDEPIGWQLCGSPLLYTSLAEGGHTFEVRAIDQAGNADQSPSTFEWTIDTKAPQTQITAKPAVLVDSETATFEFTGEDVLEGSGVASFECKLDSGGFSACTSGIEYSGLGEGTHSFEVRAIDQAGNVDGSPASYEWQIDLTPPSVSIDSGPEGLTNDNTPTFGFSSEPGASFECSIDAGAPAFGSCSSAGSHTPSEPLADGSYSFRVRATDAAGNQSSATRSFTVDATAPETQIGLKPAALVNSATATFQFSGEDPGGSGVASYQCKLDEASFVACASGIEYTELGEGSHEFEVRAIDQAGNVDASPASYEWQIDLTPPSVSIDSGPEGLTNDPTPTFAFSSEPGAGFECSIDSGTPAFGPCSGAGSHTPESPLADGEYTFRVRATDTAGNQATATRDFEVDATVPPAPVLSATVPASPANHNTPKVLGTAQAGAMVRLYGAADCTGAPLATATAAELEAGVEVTVGDNSTTALSATATALPENTSLCSASIVYVEDSSAPSTQIDAKPAALVKTDQATFQFSGEDPGGSGVAAFQCKLDEASFAACSSGIEYTELGEGTHSFEVRAIDQAGNVDGSPASYAWQIDLTPPSVSIDSGPATLTKDNTPTFGFSSEPGASFECSIDTGAAAFGPCSDAGSHTAAEPLADGSYTFRVRATDAAGNQAADTRSFTVDAAAPDTQIDAKPAALVNTDQASFQFSGEDPGGSGVAAFQCKLDEASFAACSSGIEYTELAEGSHSFEVRAIDNAGNLDGSPASYEWTVDTEAPDAQIANHPAAFSNSAVATFQFSGEDGAGSGVASFQCKLDEASFTACSSGVEYTGLSEGAHKFEVRAIDNAGNVDASPAAYEWSVDTIAPNTQIEANPAALVNSAKAKFEFSGEDPGGSGVASFQCKLDEASFAACASGIEYTELGEGAHEFEVRAIDNAGNVDGTSASYEWSVDLTAPQATIDSLSKTLLKAGETSEVAWHGDQNGNFELGIGGVDCDSSSILDSGAYASAPSPVVSEVAAGQLAEGENTLRLCIADAAGNRGEATATLIKDTIAPSTQIDSAPAALVNSAKAKFEFSGEDPGGSGVASYQCKLDEASFAACSSGIEYTELAEGAHKFEVRAIDNAGNVDAGPASHEWSVDTTPPAVSVDSGPEGLSNDPTPTFAFSSEPGAGFQCSIDTGTPSFGPCSDEGSDTPEAPLADGEYTFRVRATDAAGNQATATRGFEVDATAPETQITLKPATLINTDQASFEFSGEDPGGSGVASFQCKLDEASFAACSSGIEYAELAEGGHSFEVRAIDNAGNVDAGPASHEWSVDTLAPSVQIDSGPAPLVAIATAEFEFSGEDPGGSGVASFQCKLDEASFAACSSGIEYTELAEGSHSFEVRAIDNAGNVDAGPASHEWSVDTTPPALSIDSGPEGLTNDPTPTFAFSSEPGAGFECSIDDGTPDFGPCSGAASHTPSGPLPDGPHTFRVRATDAATNQSVATRDFIVDTAAPAGPELTATDPASPVNDNNPKLIGAAPPGTTIKLYSGADCSGSPIATKTAAELEAGIAVTVPDDSTTTFRATATTAAENTSGCSEPIVYVEDSSAPSTQITAKPAALVNSAKAKFEFSGEDPGGSGVASFQCKLDEASFAACASGIEYTELGEGAHEFEVRAIDNAGNVDTSPAAYEWSVNTVAPSTQITAKPAALVNSAKAKFEFSGEDPGGSGVASFQCKLDEASFAACSSGIEYTELAEGSHSFEVRAIDNAGNVDAGPASHEWSVDTLAPSTALDSHPAAISSSADASFAFSADDSSGSGVASFQCRRDSGEAADWEPCSSAKAYKALAEGSHKFEVRAIDNAGNTDQSPAAFEWEVDTKAPNTQIDAKPASLVNSNTATFEFSGPDAEPSSGVASYQCKLDEASFAACSSGIEYTELGEGSHSFEVRAIDNAGNVDASPASYEWSVDTLAPSTQITAKPAALVNSAKAKFEFSGEDPGGSGVASFQCKLDEASFAACSSGIEYTELGEGSHSFEVRAIDNAGNVDAGPASHEWSVDTTPPALSIDSGPEGLTNDPTPTFAFSSEPGAGFECSIDTGTPAFGPCSDEGSHTPEAPLADGEYTFRVRATDAASNQATATRGFKSTPPLPPAPR